MPSRFCQNKQANRHIKKIILQGQYGVIDLAEKNSLTGQIPDWLIKKLVDNARGVAPWLTYDKAVDHYHTQVKKRAINVEVDALVVSGDEDEAKQNVGGILRFGFRLSHRLK